ncbi:aminopeptidase [Haloarcula sp. Atlit-7R]|uniref:aminopeptidase n=1 Tax=Haloarcula sp. Atlit-7R TaxID=2282125 RepID=UPI000EF16B69|nr:aminopeptidase [Haloarcula sp. Atlit-7R]RLM90048.1 aminopeptidase [Haloarcula sp. Atlit-7R]
MEELRQAAETAVQKCLKLKSTESCLVVTDEVCQSVGEAIYEAAEAVTEESSIIRYSPGNQFSEEPPSSVAAAMKEADVVFAPTANSLSHTQARSSATSAGARVATLPTITEEVFITGLAADYSKIAEECERIYSQVSGAKTITVTTKKGTDITFKPGNRSWFQDTGIVESGGEMTNLPAGEVFMSPETADGTFVVDGTMRPHGLLDSNHQIQIDVEDGYVTNISDKDLENEVQAAAESVGDAAYNLAELGIGTNTGVTELVGSVLLDEKAANTVHIAIGDDHAIGGDTSAPIHLDGVIREPTVYADGEVVELPTGL